MKARRDSAPAPTLVLVDIDGTLVDCQGQVRPLFAAALREIYGTAGDIAGYEFSGKLDSQIVLDLMTGAGVDAARARRDLPRLRTRYLEILEAGLRAEAIRLLPGVVEFLQALSRRPDTTLALLTGNFRGGASLKLRSFDIERYFLTGAFGDDGFRRADLPPVAIERAHAASGQRAEPRDVWVVGDSRLDVECALAHGLRPVAVATGLTSAENLRAAGAEFVFRDLSAALLGLPLFRD